MWARHVSIRSPSLDLLRDYLDQLIGKIATQVVEQTESSSKDKGSRHVGANLYAYCGVRPNMQTIQKVLSRLQVLLDQDNLKRNRQRKDHSNAQKFMHKSNLHMAIPYIHIARTCHIVQLNEPRTSMSLLVSLPTVSQCSCTTISCSSTLAHAP